MKLRDILPLDGPADAQNSDIAALLAEPKGYSGLSNACTHGGLRSGKPCVPARLGLHTSTPIRPKPASE
jgi:hypothetical protein